MGMNVKRIRKERLIKNYRECDISLKILLFESYITISIDIIGKKVIANKITRLIYINF